MVKNQFGGNKAKRRKNDKETSIDIIFKTNDQLYGRIDNILGNKRFDVFCSDGTTKLGIVAGSLRKRVWINKDDIVLIDCWDFQKKKCSIVHKYSDENINTLLSSNEITEAFKNNPNSFSYEKVEYDPFDWDTSNDTDNNIDIDKINNDNSYIQSYLLPDNDSSDESINIDDI